MKQVIANILPTLCMACLIALGGLFLQVSGQEIRLVNVEHEVETLALVQAENMVLAHSIDKKQDRMMFKLCLIINDGNISECTGDRL